MVLSACAEVLIVAAILTAQEVNPRGISPPRRNTPDNPEREANRDASRRADRIDSPSLDRRLTLIQIKKDFHQIQAVNDELQRITSNATLDYKRISDAASKIRALAGRLNSNLALGKSESKEARPQYEFNAMVLRSSLFSLHDLVVRFVENPIFRERDVFDIPETKRAKGDMDDIIFLSKQIKKIAKRLRENESR